MKDVPYTLKIHNVVATGELDERIDLGTIIENTPLTELAESTEYRPEQFPGLVYRPESAGHKDVPAKAILIFSTGKMVCTGAKSPEDAEKAIYGAIKHVIKRSFDRKLKKPVKIVNIVASGDFHGYIKLDEIDHLHGYLNRYQVMYEPDQFPAAIVRDKEKYELKKGGVKIVERRSVLLLFSGGKYVSTGSRTRESLESRVEDLYNALFELGLLVEKE